MKESLYKRVQGCIPPQKCVVSDPESLMLNMRDFHINQISPVHATLQSLNVNVSYPFRVFLSFLDAFAQGMRGCDFNIILSDPSLGVAAYHAWLRSGGSRLLGRVYAPKGMPKFPQRDGIYGELFSDFEAALDTTPAATPVNGRKDLFTFVLGNTKSAEQTLFAVDRFVGVERGLLVLKDYARGDAFDERDYLESKKIFPAVTFEGHAFVIRF